VLGLEAQYHFLPDRSVDPWLGLGAGYEYLSQNLTFVSDDPQDSFETTFHGTYRGPEFVNLQAGLDLKPADALAIGPFVSFSIGEFTSQTLEGSGASVGLRARHEWLTIGIKGTLGLGA
jgi:hypothetical protein